MRSPSEPRGTLAVGLGARGCAHGGASGAKLSCGSGAERERSEALGTKEVLGSIMDFLAFKDFLGFPYSCIRIS